MSRRVTSTSRSLFERRWSLRWCNQEKKHQNFNFSLKHLRTYSATSRSKCTPSGVLSGSLHNTIGRLAQTRHSIVNPQQKKGTRRLGDKLGVWREIISSVSILKGDDGRTTEAKPIHGIYFRLPQDHKLAQDGEKMVSSIVSTLALRCEVSEDRIFKSSTSYFQEFMRLQMLTWLSERNIMSGSADPVFDRDIGDSDPLVPCAQQMVQMYSIIYLNDWQVNGIADAMILRRCFSHFFAAGMIFVGTGTGDLAPHESFTPQIQVKVQDTCHFLEEHVDFFSMKTLEGESEKPT